MYLTGFADEAANDIEGQIRATKELGWQYIEARAVGGGNLHDIPEADFDAVAGKLDDAGVRVNCFGSTIANWGCSITDPFEDTLERVGRAIPRMQRLESPLVRVMSYAVLEDRAADDQMEEERFRRLREIVARFSEAGVTVVHENCMNYGGMGWPFTLKMLENVPGLKLVFDTGNPVFSRDRASEDPDAMQSTWGFYEHVKEHIAYVHIKDGKPPEAGSDDHRFTYPGEGNGDVKRVVKALLDDGYEGGFSMEPHMAVLYHDASVQSEDEVRYQNYVEYGRRFMKLLDEIGHGGKHGAM